MRTKTAPFQRFACQVRHRSLKILKQWLERHDRNLYSGDFMDIEVLRRAPLFATLDDDAFRLLTDELTEVDLSRGASVFREGDQGDQLYFIVSGKVKLGRTSPDGRESLLAILGPGELFGEMALFDPSPRTATATAVSETRLAGLKNESLNALLRTRPEVSAQLLQALARRLRRTNDSLSDLVFSDVPGRVAKALLDLADRFGRPATDGVLVAHELTQEELAQLVGASRETVNKALAEFVQRGWLRLEARAVVILDMQRLRQRSR
jgi:CRP/FNR family transcriptional regulator